MPLVAAVEFGNGVGPVEALKMDPDAPVDNGGLEPESDPVLDSPGNPDVELLKVVVARGEDVAMVSVDELTPVVKLPLGLREVNTIEETGDMVEDMLEPGILEAPVGPTLVTVELGIGNGVV